MPTDPLDVESLYNEHPLDEDSLDSRQLLENLQGNILKGHGRDFGVYIFFRFTAEPDRAKRELRGLSHYVTSAYRQHQDAAIFRKFSIPGCLFGSLLLSSAGYRYLGFNDVDDAFREPAEPDVLSTFAHGHKPTAVEDFADPPVKDWEEPYREEIHAMLLLADDDELYLLRRARHVMQKIERHSTILTVERGKALRNQDGKGVEHFGFIDGRSQPLYVKSDFKHDPISGRRIGDRDGGSIDTWDPFLPLHRILVRDPYAPKARPCFGSYLVYRKLEQDVMHFLMREQELADCLVLQGSERARAGAMAVGRFRDGTPIAVSRTAGYRPEQENNFTYHKLPHGGHDRDGLLCPFHAHIRRTNPRGDIEPDPVAGSAPIERQRMIARRGIPYGDRLKHPAMFQSLDELPSAGVGLLFMCFQATIRKQFAFIQRHWSNSERALSPARTLVGLDPLTGCTGGKSAPQLWAPQYGGPCDQPFTFQGFVRTKGGEFFVAPSIPFFAVLGD